MTGSRLSSTNKNGIDAEGPPFIFEVLDNAADVIYG